MSAASIPSPFSRASWRADSADVGARLRQVQPGAYAADDVPVVRRPRGVRRAQPRSVDPDVGAAREVEGGRHDPDDGVALAVEAQAAELDSLAEGTPPEGVGDDRRSRSAGRALLGQERAPGLRLELKHAEEVARDHHDAGAGRLLPTGDGHRVGGILGERVEGAAARAHIDDVRLGDPHGPARRADLAQLDDAVRVRIGERAEHDSIDDGPHSRTHADAEGERDDRGERVAGARAQDPGGVAQVLPGRLHRRQLPHRAHVLPGDREVAELAARGAPGLLGRHPGGEVPLDLELEVELELVVEILLRAAPVEPARQEREMAPERHQVPSSPGTGASTRAIA